MHAVLNMACSLDGRVAGPEGRPLTLSCQADLERVHHLRGASDAILVGIGTVLADDPQLTARVDPPPGTPPLRVVLDTDARTPEDANVVDDQAPTLILTGQAAPTIGEAEVAPIGRPITPRAVLEALEARGVDRLMVEGGPQVAASFLEAGVLDRVHLYIAPCILGAGPSLPQALAGCSVELEPRARAPLGEGTLLSFGVPS